MRGRRYPGVLLPVLLLTGCAAASGSTPAASSMRGTVVVHGTGTARPFDEYELQDLHTYAQSSGTPFDEVLASQRGGRELDALVAALEADADSGIVMAGRDRDRPGTASMSFTHAPTGSVRNRLEALPLDTTVTSGLPLPHAELVRYSESLVGALDRIPGVRLLSCGPDALGDAVELRYAVTGTAPSPAALHAAAVTATEHWSRDGRLKVPVHFTAGRLSERLGTTDTAPTDGGT